MHVWNLNLRHFRALAATARLGRVSRAAQAIGISQPAITQALAKLETAFGFALFDRRADGMVPTHATELLAPRIDAALAHIASSRITMVQARALIAVADGGGYEGASATTGLSAPSLHRAVRDLSLALGRSLVERRGRGTVLTEAGRRVARALRLARAELEAGLSEVAALAGRETGRITIGAMPLARARLLPTAVTAFHAENPEMAIRIVEGSYAELIEPLRDGDIDLLLGALRLPSLGDDLVQQVLFEDRPVVIGRTGHPLANAAGVGPEGLGLFPWTVSSPGTPLRVLWERLFSEAQLPIPPVRIECGSVITIRQILLGSDFLTLLSPDQVAAEIEAGWLTKICDAPPTLVRSIGITTRAGWRPTAKQAAFVRHLVQASIA